MGRLTQVVPTPDALRFHLHADMLHEALRADVLSATRLKPPARLAM